VRAILSLVRGSLYSLVAFAALTASLALAFSFAIAGPPTDEEMLGLGRGVSVALERAGIATDRLAERFCEASDLCGDRQAEAVDVSAPEGEVTPVADALAPSAREEPAPVPAAPDLTAADAALLGSADGAAPPRRTTTRPSPPRTERSAAPARRRAVRTPSPPITVERSDPLEQLAERVEEMLSQTPAAYEPDFPPGGVEQEPQSEPYDEGAEEGWWEEEPPPEEPYYWRRRAY
jgi:hypothetical protein